MKINKIILTTENPKHADGSLFPICLGGYKMAKPAKDIRLFLAHLYFEKEELSFPLSLPALWVSWFCSE